MSFFLSKIKKQWRYYFLAFLFLANFFIWYAVYWEDRQGVLTINFLDVGQGDSIFIDTPSGNQILIDGGPDDKVLKELGKVMPFYDRDIDLVMLTHPHQDHVGGLVQVLKRYSVGEVISSGTEYESAQYKAWRETLKEKNITEILGRRGMRVEVGDGIYLDILLPATDVKKAKPHDGMLVARLSYASSSVMLTGDMEKNLEDYLIFLDNKGLKSDILKVGHHGSRTSSSEAFLGYVNPDWAIISNGKKNRYGHPHAEIIKRLKDFKIETLRTDREGTIRMMSDGNKFVF